jgi:spore maturation protein CgeB
MGGMNIVVIGLSITSSWGNGHATTYRSLLRALAALGHDVLFLERDLPWYADNRDLAKPNYARVELYSHPLELKERFRREIRTADLVIVGSYVPDGIEIGTFVVEQATGITAFYDIDTPVTLTQLAGDAAAYISRALIPKYALYLSFTGGPVLSRLEREFGARAARPLYCSVDPEHYAPEPCAAVWQVGYMGTYSADRQAGLERLLLAPARLRPELKFAVVGPQYPETVNWPDNVTRVSHLESDARPDASSWLVAKRAPIRSCSLRSRNHQRCLGGHRGFPSSRKRAPDRGGRFRHTPLPP